MKNGKKPALRPGLSTMKQGSERKGGDAGKCGEFRQVMHQGSTPTRKSPAGNLRRIMGQ